MSFSNHESFSHDSLNRYLGRDKLTAQLVWENVRDQVVLSKRGYVLFDDTILDKNFSHKIGLVKRQYSGNAHGIIKGIGVVNCVYVRNIIDPANFSRFNDGIIQASILRAAYPEELSYGIDNDTSQEMTNTLETIIKY